LLLAGVLGGVWFTSRPGWRTTRLFDREVERLREASAERYIKDTRRYESLNYVVAQGEPAVAVILPRLREGDAAERFVAAMMLGTVLRQVMAKTRGTKQAGAISESTLKRIVGALREAHDVAAKDSYLKGMIARDLQHLDP